MSTQMQVTRAGTVEVGEARATIRNPVAMWILTVITLGIVGIFWWYGVNREVRDVSRAFGRPIGGSPIFMALLFALWPIAWIPAIISLFLGSRWVRTLEQGVGIEGTTRPILAALLVPVLFLQVIYVQRHANEIWRRAAAGARPEPDWTAASGREQAMVEAARQQAEGDARRWR
jgi:hypothetical protein